MRHWDEQRTAAALGLASRCCTETKRKSKQGHGTSGGIPAMMGPTQYFRAHSSAVMNGFQVHVVGEGGLKDERSALALLQRSPADAQHPRALLGRLMLEGRVVPRDVAKAVQLLLPRP